MTYSPGYPVPPVQTQVVLQPHRCSTAHVVVAWIVAVLTLAYMLPWAIAASRNRSNVAAIALINLFLGWSLIGWVVALVMACGSDSPVVVVQHTYSQQSYGQQLYGPQGYGPQGYAPQAGPGWTQAPGYTAPYAAPPQPAALPSAPAAPARPAAWEPEPTRVDPFGTEPTVWLPPTYGTGTEPDHRR